MANAAMIEFFRQDCHRHPWSVICVSLDDFHNIRAADGEFFDA
jgi:hypothetical protein